MISIKSIRYVVKKLWKAEEKLTRYRNGGIEDGVETSETNLTKFDTLVGSYSCNIT